MNFATSTFKAFRTCAASPSSSRIFTRPLVPCRLLGARRHYSEGTASTSEGGKAKDPQEEKGSTSDLEEKMKAKDAEVVDLTGRLRYLQADFLNLQRNAAREKEQTRDFAITRFASDLLETVDVLAMALKSVPATALSTHESSQTSTTPPPEPLPKSHEAYLRELYTGVEMTHRLLLQTLFKYHVKPFDPTGDKFDPNQHEALYQVPIPGEEPGTVIDCQKTGYTIKDRVLRAAQVGVVQDAS
ncbi:hypothetical protein K443DRAFT_672149 [Laccaria amethystina LaAM-08-1]|uniref:GrpE protein homolog, mitochondrial n=1 Tax=Laccaria amethystina LaAM-08-1 TaxID=1095629 RepID=A0A0C9X8S9_9AGAR|nr:hypothetical protein K443DRAFT_672149 [Laccaria amethystina LaAM-08-1]